MKLGIALILVVLSIAACTGAPSSVPGDASKYSSLKGDPARGREKFIGTCSACHGNDARGLPGLGKDLTKSAFVKNISDAELIAFVIQGRPAGDPANTTQVDMPPKGGNPILSDQDIANIVAYLRALQR